MSDPMQEIRASFFVECEELLEALQDGLQALEDGGDDPETINVIFRAVHSIKGGAGAFGHEALVVFAHNFESALDCVRTGATAVDEDTVKLFFQCGDHLADHVRAARDGTDMDGMTGTAILEALVLLAGETPGEEDPMKGFEPTAIALDLDFGEDSGEFGVPVPTPGWDIRFEPRAGLYQSGNEPLFLMRALRELGEVTVRADASRIPDLEALDPLGAYLHWTVHLVTDETAGAIREVFDFVEDVCELEIAAEARGDARTATLPAFEDVPDDLHKLEHAKMEEQPEAPAAPHRTATSDQKLGAGIPKPVPQQASTEPRPALAPKATVRVDLDRVDRLVNLVGELVINQAMLSQSIALAGVPTNSPVTAGLDEFLQLTRDIQESVMAIRAQPVKSLFQRMSRIVREAALGVGKDVRLRTEGDATEIDKTVIELLAEPLTHMIRNAVDHGLERPDVRLAAGKSSQGVVTLTAGHRSGRVVIEVSDDGAGIDRPHVLARAIEKGLIPHATELTDAEVDAILFMPGFSTVTEVSSLSGRGVGMDVVKTAIASLGGRITITSTPGIGTSFSISLPLTLAVLDGMVIRVAGETLVVPLTAIVETLTLSRDEIRALGPETQVVKVRDAFVPLLDLGTELGYREPLDDYVGTIALLIAQEDGSRTAIVVDAIEDQRQVVIKGLHDSYGRVRGVAAATILGDGQIALILDSADLVANATGRSRRLHQPTALAG